jgi:hypothetical protein
VSNSPIKLNLSIETSIEKINKSSILLKNKAMTSKDHSLIAHSLSLKQKFNLIDKIKEETGND